MALLEDYLYSEEFLFEGEQAEAYKKRKSDQAVADRKKEYDRNSHRYQSGSTTPGRKAHIDMKSFRNASDSKMDKMMKDYDKQRDADFKRDRKAGKMVEDEENKRIKSGKSSLHTKTVGGKTGYNAQDAVNRHIRRHPKQYAESTELYGDSIELI